MADYLDRVTEFVADTRYEDLSEDAVASVRDVVLDTVGAILAGSRLPENASLARQVAERSGPATATVFGHPHKAEPMLATLVNATAGVGLEMDEGNRLGGGHPSIHTMPGALAVGEEMGVDGRRFIEAMLVGYEVESRIGAATVARPNVHSHGHWGVIGTAVAVGKLKGLDAGQMRSLINVASGMSPANTWRPCFEGATIRNAYPGRSGLMGILAFHMYQAGFTGVEDGPSDVFGTIIGESFDPDVVLDGLGGEYRIQQNYTKFHACCATMHPPIEAALAVRTQDGFSLDEVDTIEVGLKRFLPEMVGPYPRNMLGAKFSVPYSIASALVRGSADVTTFYPEAIDDDRVRAVAARVRISEDTESSRSEDGPTARAWVKMKDGRTLTSTVGIVPGDRANPLPREATLSKFRFLTSGILDPRQAEDVIRLAGDHLQDLQDVRELTFLLGSSDSG
jgi:2-methylcitrate dehydratase PrpD